MSLQSLPVMLQKVKMGQSSNFNGKNSNIMEIDEIQIRSEQKYQAAVQTVMEVDNAYTFSRESVNLGKGRASFNRKVMGIQHTEALYEDIALPDAFLNDYYSQVLWYNSYTCNYLSQYLLFGLLCNEAFDATDCFVYLPQTESGMCCSCGGFPFGI